MSNIKLGGLKVDNMNDVNVINAPANAVKINEEVENTSKDMPESTEKATQAEAKEQVVKHVLVYIGQSEFTDTKGNKWHKNDEHTFDEKDYANRDDLQFMVNYGEMKHTIVTM